MLILSKVHKREPPFSEDLRYLNCTKKAMSFDFRWLRENNRHVRPLILTFGVCWQRQDDKAQSASLAWSLKFSRARKSCGGRAMVAQVSSWQASKWTLCLAMAANSNNRAAHAAQLNILDGFCKCCIPVYSSGWNHCTIFLSPQWGACRAVLCQLGFGTHHSLTIIFLSSWFLHQEIGKSPIR